MNYADKMKAAIPQLVAQHGVTEEKVKSIVSDALNPVLATIQDVLKSEKSDEDKLQDIGDAMDELTTAANPTDTTAGQPAAGDETGVAAGAAPAAGDASTTGSAQPDATSDAATGSAS